MPLQLLQNFSAVRRVLRYDDSSGRAEEVSSTGGEELSEGFYVDPERDLGGHNDRLASGAFLGYYETDDGPVFFRNAERWTLGRESRFEVRQGDQGYEVTLWQGQERLLAQAYPGPLPVNLFFPEDEEYRDPFQWLALYVRTPGFHACRIGLTLADSRRLLALDEGSSADPSPARHLDRHGRCNDEEKVRMAQAMVLLLEQGQGWEQEMAVQFLLRKGPPLSLLRRLARSYAARGWDARHPAVRLFARYRDWLGRGGRATLRRCLASDERRHAALREVLDAPSGE
jgi:hypothetical protein